MNCHDAAASLDAWLDGEAAPADAAEVERHLADCDGCKCTLVERLAEARRLRTVFADLPDRARVVAERVAELVTQPQRRPRFPTPLAWLASAAAGLLAGFILFTDWRDRPIVAQDNPKIEKRIEPTPVPETLAELTLATGAVEVRADESATWTPLAVGAKIPVGAYVRTAPASRCELRWNDGSEMRLDAGSEIVLVAARNSDLRRGCVYNRVQADPALYRVSKDGVRATASAAEYEVRAANDDDFHVTVFAGSASVESQGARDSVGAYRRLAVHKGRLQPSEPVEDVVAATRWIHEILVLKGPQNPELAKRVDDLLATLGRSKMTHLNEQEIRALGEHCVRPLVSYLRSPQSQKDEEFRRATAARIVADLATPDAMPGLIELLGDPSGAVRANAAAGLARLSGWPEGTTLEQWRNGSDERRKDAQDRWRAWWSENGEKYPGILKVKA